MPTFGTVLTWGLSGAIALRIMKLFKLSPEVIAEIENMFIILFTIVALSSFLKLMPGLNIQEGWIG